MIEACAAVNETARAVHYLDELQAEADAKGIALGHEATSPLLGLFCKRVLPAPATEQASRRRPTPVLCVCVCACV